MTCCDKPTGPLYWCSGCGNNSCPTCVMTCCDIQPAHVLPVALLEKTAARIATRNARGQQL